MLLSQTTRLYLDHLAAKGRADSTVRANRLTLDALRRVTGDVDTAKVEPRHVDQFFVANAHWAPGTRNQRLVGLVSFFRWCRFMRFMPRDSDPTFGWKPLKAASAEKLRIPVHEFGRLIDACENPHEDIIVATGLYLFLRGSEQRYLRIGHVSLDRNEIEVYRVKTRERDVMPISLELEEHLRGYLRWLAEQGISGPDHYLIPSRFHAEARAGHKGLVKGSGGLNPAKPFCRPHEHVQRVMARVGYPTDGEGEHTLRRSGARAYFDSLVAQGYDGALRRVQSMLGHKTSMMTERYLGLDLDRHKRNEDLRGRPMFPALRDARVVPLREGSRG